MEFIKYRTIHNYYEQEFMDEIKSQGLNKGEWIVQEKVHGANFSFWVKGDHVKVAKRTEFISPGGDNFYPGYEKVTEQEKEKIIELYSLTEAQEMVVFGELFGGQYHHPDFEKISQATCIQRGIHYSPHHHFYAFDIMVGGVYLDIDKAMELFEKVGLFYAKPLFRGSFEEVMNYPNSFQTKIPEWLGLPEIKENWCEGIVIRPVKESLLNPDGIIKDRRIIIKSKNADWEEKLKLDKKLRKEQDLSEEGNQFLNELLSYVTLNRLENVISKIGEVDKKMIGKLTGLLGQDSLEEFLRNNPGFSDLEKIEQKGIKKIMNKESAIIVQNYFDK